MDSRDSGTVLTKGSRSLETSIIKVKDKEGDDLYIKTKWSNANAFYVWVISGDFVWNGQCSSEDAIRDSERYLETAENYINTARSCLASYDDKCRYELKSKEADKLLLWKIQEARLRVCGSLQLTPCEDTTIREIRKHFLDYLLETNDQILKCLEQCTAQNSLLQIELEKSLENLNQVSKIKNETETNLYGHIVQLLNCYKRRIALLEDNFRTDGLK